MAPMPDEQMAVDRLTQLEVAVRELGAEVRDASEIRTKYQRTLIVLSVLLLVVGAYLAIGLSLFLFTGIGSSGAD